MRARFFIGSLLGLAITKKLVDIPGGSITCKSAPGKGTAFALVLPHKKANQVDIAAYYSKNAHTTDITELNGKKILICENLEKPIVIPKLFATLRQLLSTPA